MCNTKSKRFCARCAASVLIQFSRNQSSKTYQAFLRPIPLRQQFKGNVQKYKSLAALRNWGGANIQRRQRKLGF
jgi:hypothetical protein